MAELLCANPAYGTHLIVRGNQRDETLKSVLQRVMKWAEDDRDLIEHHHGGPVAYVRIPPEVIAADHGPLTLRKGGEEIPLTVDKATWVEPTIFEVDGVNPNTLIEYDLVIEDFAPKEITWDKIVLKFKYAGNFQEKTEPHGWLLRWRRKAAHGQCPEAWNLWNLPGWTRVIPFHALEPDTEYEFTIQGIARPETTDVYTPSTKPISARTKKKPAPGKEVPPVPGLPQPPKDEPKPSEPGKDGDKPKPEPDEPKPEPTPEPPKPDDGGDKGKKAPGK